MSQNRNCGRWIIHEEGSLRIQRLAEALFKSSQKRVGCDDEAFVPYQSWMSSPDLSKEFLRSQRYFEHASSKSVLDFSENYLVSIDKILTLKDKSKHDNEFNLTVFTEIEKNPKSTEIYKRAYALLERWPSWQKDVANCLLRSIIPLRDKTSIKETGNAFSDRHFIGSIFTSIKWEKPFPFLDLNISFAHELGHQSLMLYQYADDLIVDKDKWIYSGVRKTLRPPVYALHAAVALAYMIECAQSLVKASSCVLEKGYLQECVRDFVTGLRSSINSLEEIAKSEMGEFIVKDLRNLANDF